MKNGIFSNSSISIRIFVVGIVNLIKFCECNKIDELNIENRIEIDRSEAEKFEFIHESCVFSLPFFQPNIYAYFLASIDSIRKVFLIQFMSTLLKESVAEIPASRAAAFLVSILK